MRYVTTNDGTAVNAVFASHHPELFGVGQTPESVWRLSECDVGAIYKAVPIDQGFTELVFDCNGCEIDDAKDRGIELTADWVKANMMHERPVVLLRDFGQGAIATVECAPAEGDCIEQLSCNFEHNWGCDEFIQALEFPDGRIRVVGLPALLPNREAFVELVLWRIGGTSQWGPEKAEIAGEWFSRHWGTGAC